MSAPSVWLDDAGALAALAGGEVVLLQTDTLPGLHARLDRPDALAAIARLKGRVSGQTLLVIAATALDALALAAPVSPAVDVFLARCWPGPFTVILPAREGLPRAVVAGAEAGTVAVRVPAPQELRRLLAASGPLASTSANRTGEAPAGDLEHAARVFPELAIWGGLAGPGLAAASALIDLTGEAPRLLRPGPLPSPDWPA